MLVFRTLRWRFHTSLVGSRGEGRYENWLKPVYVSRGQLAYPLSMVISWNFQLPKLLGI